MCRSTRFSTTAVSSRQKVSYQKILAGAIDAPVSVMETAGEGGAWGIALLASYMINKEENETLEDYLDAKVFAGNAGTKMDPDPADVAGFEVFTERYKKVCRLSVQQ